MVLIRSLLYFLALVLTILVFGLPMALFGWIMPVSWRDAMGSAWGQANLWLQGVICGLHYRIRGREHLPHEAAIVMAKHQSTWETIALRGLLAEQQTWVLKRELMWIPVFGWAMAMVSPIAINRKAGRRAARQIIAQGTERLRQGRIVVIFPEGTRTAPGEQRKYGIGGGMLAEKSGYPVIPIAHNAGVYWKRRGMLKYPGTIDVVVGPAMDSRGKTAAEITRAVQDWIETRLAELPHSREAVSQPPR